MKRIIYTLFMVFVLSACSESIPDELLVLPRLTQISPNEVSLVISNESSSGIILESILINKDIQENKPFEVELPETITIKANNAYEIPIQLEEPIEFTDLSFTINFFMEDELHWVTLESHNIVANVNSQ